MCGINGFITRGHVSEEGLREQLEGMNNKIIHRGPDQDGFFTESNSDYSVAMAMRRLSIIDLGTGAQPIFSKDKKAYAYLSESASIFPHGEELNNILTKIGFTSVQHKPQTFGVATIYVASK